MPDSTSPSKNRLYLIAYSCCNPDDDNAIIGALNYLGTTYEVNSSCCILETSHTFSNIALWTFLKNNFIYEDDSLQIFKINKSTFYPSFNEDNYPLLDDPYLADEEEDKIRDLTKKFLENLK